MFNADWDVVALHHSGGWLTEPNTASKTTCTTGRRYEGESQDRWQSMSGGDETELRPQRIDVDELSGRGRALALNALEMSDQQFADGGGIAGSDSIEDTLMFGQSAAAAG